MPKTITRAQYLQLLGLRLLADKHYAVLETLEKAAVEITGDKGGHTSDMLGAYRSVDEALELLEITVED